MANLEYEVPITPASIFHVASISKQFTAFSVALLEREGRLALGEQRKIGEVFVERACDIVGVIGR
jgi:Beta-lactamase